MKSREYAYKAHNIGCVCVCERARAWVCIVCICVCEQCRRQRTVLSFLRSCLPFRQGLSPAYQPAWWMSFRNLPTSSHLPSTGIPSIGHHPWDLLFWIFCFVCCFGLVGFFSSVLGGWLVGVSFEMLVLRIGVSPHACKVRYFTKKFLPSPQIRGFALSFILWN